MISKIILIAILAAAFAQEDEKSYSDFEILRRLIEEGSASVEKTSIKVLKAPEDFNRIIEDRLNALKWEGIEQKRNLYKSVTEAVSKGMFKNKQFSNYQCISNAARDGENKLDAIINGIPENSKKIVDKELSNVTPFTGVMSGFNSYIEDFFKTKTAELNNAKNDDARKKILEEATKKIKLLCSVTGKIDDFLKDSLFKFFEIYVDFAFSTEKNFANTQREAVKNIMKCIS